MADMADRLKAAINAERVPSEFTATCWALGRVLRGAAVLLDRLPQPQRDADFEAVIEACEGVFDEMLAARDSPSKLTLATKEQSGMADRIVRRRIRAFVTELYEVLNGGSVGD